MAFGDRMAMGEGMSINMACGHPHVGQDGVSKVVSIDDQSGKEVYTLPTVICPLCGQRVQGSLRELPHEETSNE